MEKSTKTNVIIVNDFDYTQGGASKVAIDTANLLVENQEDLSVYFFSGDHNDISNLNDKIIKICTNQGEALKDKNKIRGFLNGIYNFKAKKEFKRLLKSLNSENTIIHVHGWTKCLSSSIFDVAFKMKFRVVLTLHDYFTACPNGGYFNYKKNEICKLKGNSCKCICTNCDSRNYLFKVYRVLRYFVQNKIVKLNQKLENVIVISEFSEKILKTTLNNKTTITKVYNPIDLDDNAKKVDLSKNEYYLYVGRISKEKGVDLFCKVISDLNLQGIVVGEGDQRQLLEKNYPNINFVGWKNSDEVKKYMMGAKALIFPSRWYEGAPLTPLEAMQFGIPCITSDCCAARDYIYEGQNGYVFHDIEDLKEKINKDIVFEGNFIKKDYQKENYINNIIRVYKKMIGDINDK